MVYHPPPVRSRAASNNSGVDGAAFGTTFPHLFLMTFANLVPDPLPADSAYVPRVFGFRLHRNKETKTAAVKTESEEDKRLRQSRKRKSDRKNDGAPAFLINSALKRRKRNGGNT